MASKCHKKSLHQIPGYSNTVWPTKGRIFFTAKSALPATTTLDTSNLQKEPMDGLKTLPRGSMSNFMSNRQHSTQHLPSNSKIKHPNDKNYQSHHSSNKEHGWSQNTSNGLHVKFQVILTSFDQTLASQLRSLRTMISKSELMDRLKMISRGSLSNFRSIGHCLTIHQSTVSSSL